MPGCTHIRYAQPTTFGHCLLAVYDLIQLKAARARRLKRVEALERTQERMLKDLRQSHQDGS